MTVNLRQEGFSPYRELELYQRQMGEMAGKYGATNIFVGSMRDLNLGDVVTKMTLEYYPGMTEYRLEQIVLETRERWNLIDALVIHRVGEIDPGEPIVLVAAWAAHREAAFEACRHIIEELKHSAPFWKKESLATGQRWVESNTCGD
ncbi:MAG: molybdenum cofactor biosynthesis protein MoaE [Methylococcaceae bacterium]|nr:molybdenum cofactor biosynthesis protein MoaE [Methylococcaceae bacterium]